MYGINRTTGDDQLNWPLNQVALDSMRGVALFRAIFHQTELNWNFLLLNMKSHVESPQKHRN